MKQIEKLLWSIVSHFANQVKSQLYLLVKIMELSQKNLVAMMGVGTISFISQTETLVPSLKSVMKTKRKKPVSMVMPYINSLNGQKKI